MIIAIKIIYAIYEVNILILKNAFGKLPSNYMVVFLFIKDHFGRNIIKHLERIGATIEVTKNYSRITSIDIITIIQYIILKKWKQA